MDYDIEVNVGVQVYGKLTEKGAKVAKEKGEIIAEDVDHLEGQDEAEVKVPALFSLQIGTDQKTLQPLNVTVYSPTTGAPFTMSCVEFELLWHMYLRGRSRLVNALGTAKKKKEAPVPEPSPAAPTVPEPVDPTEAAEKLKDQAGAA